MTRLNGRFNAVLECVICLFSIYLAKGLLGIAFVYTFAMH